MNTFHPLVLLFALSTNLTAQALEPLISRKGDLLFEDSFSGSETKPEWQALHGTRWNIEKGAFRGIPSTKKFRASRDNHTGTTPSMTLEAPARDCICL